MLKMKQHQQKAESDREEMVMGFKNERTLAESDGEVMVTGC